MSKIDDGFPYADNVPGNFAHRSAPLQFPEKKKWTEDELKALVDRFLAWPLPKSVCSDLCATMPDYPHQRTGTNLLTAEEARQMLEAILNG